jgi:hypothetical protein
LENKLQSNIGVGLLKGFSFKTPEQNPHFDSHSKEN